MKHDPENSAADDALDDAIRNAMQVEVNESRLARLEHYWNIQSQRERWRRNARRVIGLSAAAVVVVAGLLLVWSREQRIDTAQVVQDSSRQVVESVPAIVPLTENTVPIKPSLSAGRPPTAYEQLMFAARTGVEMRHVATAAKLDEAIRSVAANGDVDAAKIVASSGLKRAEAEAHLLRRLEIAPADDQHAVLRMLAACGSPRSAPALLQLAQHESLRTEALATLEQLIGIEGLARVVRQSPDPNVRSALMLRLLTAGSDSGLLGYLSLVLNGATRAEALSVAKTEPKVPVAELITLLDHGEEPVRMAAAMTLGHINGPETTRLLITRITEKPANSSEAWIALMACRGDMARDFLEYATRRPQLLGYYNNARVRWAQMIP